MIDYKSLKEKCLMHRKQVLNMCLQAKTGHLTSSMSSVEILVTLYYGQILKFDHLNPESPLRDRLILSKAQASPLLYSILADLGFYSERELNLFAQKDGIFGVHLQNTVPGVETTAGALGHGLGIAAGIALKAKMDRELFMTYVLLGDGELYEGSIWESLKFASHHNLNNLVGIIDRNFLCTTDFTENIIELEPLDQKIKSFGWNCITIDGHDVAIIHKELETLKSRPSRKPTMLICKTVKGKGVPSMCYDPLNHGIAPRENQVDAAKKDLGI